MGSQNFLVLGCRPKKSQDILLEKFKWANIKLWVSKDLVTGNSANRATILSMYSLFRTSSRQLMREIKFIS